MFFGGAGPQQPTGHECFYGTVGRFHAIRDGLEMTFKTIGGGIAIVVCGALLPVLAIGISDPTGLLPTLGVAAIGVCAAFGFVVGISAILASLPWGRRRHWTHRFSFFGLVNTPNELGLLALKSRHSHIIRDVRCVIKMSKKSIFSAPPNGAATDEYFLNRDGTIHVTYPSSFVGLTCEKEKAKIRWIAHTEKGREVLLWKGKVNLTGPWFRLVSDPMSAETIVRRLGWIALVIGAISMSVYYGSTNEPIWPIVVIVLSLILLGSMRPKKSN
jgi:hypothetical protein